jgi:hypothetical protein
LKGLRFSIRDLLLLTTITALAVGWWLDNREKSQRIIGLDLDSRKWHLWAQYFQEQLNGTQVAGKWIFPWTFQFDPDGERVTMPKRQADGDSIVPVGSLVEWRKEWAEMR